jgi:hypothetical protein
MGVTSIYSGVGGGFYNGLALWSVCGRFRQRSFGR